MSSEARDYQRESELRRKYSMGLRDYEVMLSDQNYRCAICQRHIDAVGKLYIDHDHRTNRVRALLCQGCNFGLGFFKDNPRLLAAALVYLEDYS